MLGDLSRIEKIYLLTRYMDMKKQVDDFCFFYKRYENGRLKRPRTGEEARQISHQQLR